MERCRQLPAGKEWTIASILFRNYIKALGKVIRACQKSSPSYVGVRMYVVLVDHRYKIDLKFPNY
ncbi:hypothetical protein BMR07_18310 [Methylococcaceae bacterium CS1]|nr:hypothetical protein BMR10_17555 [Methylococcaceae bacterium CS4]TXL00033.1 hypothetical protein BMR11_04380 [Methylococcaceae bacterium CS5]TXL02183.1 hypothetical protein BMR07_18310 [Methylococcaceae bacterium CS1]TXL02438.1 hypothetical protein BMR08_18340 [Methylococcaceae bacterium CS2]TXL06691.1 hypothetical protein BMR09_07125 [Methylococcaceae bacterium CS3]